MKEKMKNRFQWHIVLLVALLLLFSVLCWLSFAKSVAVSLLSKSNPTETVQSADAIPGKSTAQAAINKPARFLARIDSITDALDTKWYEKMFRKSSLSKMDSIFTYYTTGEIASSQVMRGTDNWLFYKSTTDGDTIGDYEGTNLYTPEDLDAILETVLPLQEIIQQRGTRFALLFPPNKETLYSRYMPDGYNHSPANRTEELALKLREHGVNAHFPLEALMENSEAFRLYYSNDTHWNQLGAYIGTKEVLASWGIEMPELSDRDITSHPLKDHHRFGATADLAGMAGLTFAFDDEEDFIVSGTTTVDWSKFAKEQDKEQISHFSNENAMLDASLLLVGDSFRISMVPSLSEVFSDVYVVHRSFYTSDMLDEIKPDYLIVQMVERYSDAVRQLGMLV